MELATIILVFIVYKLNVVISEEKIDGSRPHIIFILADDLGWNDVGFHGLSQIPTPNIDALAYSGIILNNYYVNPICTPSRSALMTGKHPIHTGMQHTVLFGAEPRGLPLSERLLPEFLADLGYENHMVGKWHLGSYKKEYTPLFRGFTSHLGYWTGHQDYNDHTAMEQGTWGLDMRRGMNIAWDLHGKYSTDIFTDESVRIIKNHTKTKPLFLYLAHAAVHSGNPYNPLPSPDSLVANFSHIDDYSRRRFAGILSKLDESVGKVVAALAANNMLDKSIIIFSTDNGGPAQGFNLNAASNWPLRGVKNTLWEGGVRGAGLLWSPLLAKPKRIATQTMHITDWLPTLYSAAGGNYSDLGRIDGLDLWKTLSENSESQRHEVLHNIDDIYGNAALTKGDWKIVKGTSYDGAWDYWYGPSGREGFYDMSKIFQSDAGKALSFFDYLPTQERMTILRSEAEITCESQLMTTDSSLPCQPLIAPCLFNIRNDPCEKYNMASTYPNILIELEDALNRWNTTAVAPKNLPIDPRGNPKYWNYVWTNFGDYSAVN